MHKRDNLRKGMAVAAGLIGIAVAVALGFWQLGRAAQKQAWHEARTQQAGAAPLDAQSVRAALMQRQHAAAMLEHRRVALQGQWLAEQTVYLDNRQMQGRPGFYVLTPLQLVHGDVVMVQRGWIARNFQHRTQLLPVQTPNGQVHIEGYVSGPPARTWAMSDGDAPDGQNPQIRQNLHLSAWAQATGLNVWPITLIQTGEASEGLLRDWPVASSGIATHHGYAFQWFAIAAVLAIMLVWFQFLRPVRVDD